MVRIVRRAFPASLFSTPAFIDSASSFRAPPPPRLMRVVFRVRVIVYEYPLYE